ncbi:MAG: 16S rRNA (cytosine(1402)-N(4))-methyltransferase RsmH [Candidatus Glassbacteria bacterium]|nr:16S rRNA (cytosine(1402)-N(4))-methyltransferase RsmH [Candidatus Glassbacteria bacterium]
MGNHSSFHRPVLLEETISLLRPRSSGRYLDGTVGGGGHARALLEASSPGGRLWGLDRDPEAIEETSAVLKPFANRSKLFQANFRHARELLPGLALDGILLDLGVSSYQLDTTSRGFSCDRSGPLDMRMDTGERLSAAQVLEEEDEEAIAVILRRCGEEPFSRKIAREIVAVRRQQPVRTTGELAEIVCRAVPRRAERKSLVRVFQALRIQVNDEIGALESALESLFGMLAPEGRLAVISYHSLEDRPVKRYFNSLADPCTCPPDLPFCACGRVPTARVVTRKPVKPAPEEIETNPRSRSAKLRVLEKLAVS